MQCCITSVSAPLTTPAYSLPIIAKAQTTLRNTLKSLQTASTHRNTATQILMQTSCCGIITYLLHYLPTMESFFGKPEYLCQISVSTHGPQGFITLATADGRLAGTTYSDGSVSAAPGTDKNGVYALFESATVYDHSQNQNAQMNLKLHPSSVQGVQGTRKLLELVRTYMRKGGFHVQFNVVSSDTLKEAQKTPDQYRDLMVRVAGFTQYWCEIGKPIQDEVIYRTEYEEV